MPDPVFPGENCPSCGRKVPTDKPPTQRQQRFAVTVPVGEEGVLDELLIQWTERVQARWPEEVGELGSTGWRYRALHFGLVTLATGPDSILPSEVGG